MYPKEIKTGSQRDMCPPEFTATFFTIAKIYKQTTSPKTNEQIQVRVTEKRLGRQAILRVVHLQGRKSAFRIGEHFHFLLEENSHIQLAIIMFFKQNQ